MWGYLGRCRQGSVLWQASSLEWSPLHVTGTVFVFPLCLSWSPPLPRHWFSLSSPEPCQAGQLTLESTDLWPTGKGGYCTLLNYVYGLLWSKACSCLSCVDFEYGASETLLDLEVLFLQCGAWFRKLSGALILWTTKWWGGCCLWTPHCLVTVNMTFTKVSMKLRAFCTLDSHSAFELYLQPKFLNLFIWSFQLIRFYPSCMRFGLGWIFFVLAIQMTSPFSLLVFPHTIKHTKKKKETKNPFFCVGSTQGMAGDVAQQNSTCLLRVRPWVQSLAQQKKYIW